MKNLITLLFIVFAFGATAQINTGKSEMVIMDKSGDSFYLIIDDVVQNVVPKYQLKVVGIPATYHRIKLLYTSGVTINLQENVTLQPYKQYTAFVNWKNDYKRLEWVEIANINQTEYGKNVEVVLFTTPQNVICYLCTTPTVPGFHYHQDGSTHINYSTNGGNHPPHGNHPNHGNHPPNSNNNQNCYNPLPTIQPIMDELNSISFAAKQLEYAKDALANKCITSEQAYEIVELFTFDKDRVQIAKYCYDRMSDQLYANKLLDLFPFSGTRDEVRKYFTK